jgi:hypothetical protein
MILIDILTYSDLYRSKSTAENHPKQTLFIREPPSKTSPACRRRSPACRRRSFQPHVLTAQYRGRLAALWHVGSIILHWPSIHPKDQFRFDY